MTERIIVGADGRKYITNEPKPAQHPDALQLAKRLEQFNKDAGPCMANEAAAELRRLHEVNQELLEALKVIAGIGNKRWGHDWEEIDEARAIARAAIARAERRQE